MFKKYFLIVLTFLILASIVCVIGCGKSGFAGTYINQDNPSDYLELKPDGTFYSYEGGIGFNGEWEVKGNELRLSWMGFVVTGEIKGNMITFPTTLFGGSEVWVKKSNNFTSQLTKIESPSEVVKSFIEAIERGDYYKAKDCFSSEHKEEFTTDSFNRGRVEIKKHGGIKKIDITGEYIENEHAEVYFSIEYKDGTTEDEPGIHLPLVKEGNKWKITE